MYIFYIFKGKSLLNNDLNFAFIILSPAQLNSYCRNQVARIDLPVLARICDYLKCEISDILKYIPADE